MFSVSGGRSCPVPSVFPCSSSLPLEYLLSNISLLLYSLTVAMSKTTSDPKRYYIRIINPSYCNKHQFPVASHNSSLFLVMQSPINLSVKQWLKNLGSFYPVVASSLRPSESFIFSRVAWGREKEWKFSWNMLWSELEAHWPAASHMAMSRC